MVSFALQSDEIAESLKPTIADRLLKIHGAVAAGLELVRLSPREAPQAVTNMVGMGLSDIGTDIVDTLGLFTQKAATALPHFINRSSKRESILADLIDPFDLNDLDGDGDTLFTDVAAFYGITEAEARELFQDFLILGLLSIQWWEMWVQRQRVFLLQRIGTSLAELAGEDDPVDYLGRQGLTDRQKAVVLGSVRESLVGTNSRSALASASVAVSTQVAAVTNAIIVESVQRNQDQFSSEPTYQWSAVLDSRVCVRCGGLNGKIVRPTNDPSPPLHALCRCLLIPVLEGQEPAETVTFRQWLKSRSSQTQDAILGKTGGQRFRNGELRIGNLSTLRGRVPARQRFLGEVD